MLPQFPADLHHPTPLALLALLVLLVLLALLVRLVRLALLARLALLVRLVRLALLVRLVRLALHLISLKVVVTATAFLLNKHLVRTLATRQLKVPLIEQPRPLKRP